MRVVFLKDYLGRETSMIKYKQGDEIELPHQIALDLIGFNIVKEKNQEQERPQVRKSQKREVQHDTDT